jgi:hypothetical protein
MRRSGPPPPALDGPTLLRPREILHLGESAVAAIGQPDRSVAGWPPLGVHCSPQRGQLHHGNERARASLQMRPEWCVKRAAPAF